MLFDISVLVRVVYFTLLLWLLIVIFFNYFYQIIFIKSENVSLNFVLNEKINNIKKNSQTH